jgi:NAD(P)-dependent dehydrogenase (short-subunit alcohol dehydrogenase family)
MKSAPAHTAVLAGMVAVITGTGPNSIATARAVARAGASIALAAPDEEAMVRTVRTVRAAGAEAIAVPTDLGDRGAVRRLVATALDNFGRLDLAVNSPRPVRHPGALAVPDCRAVYLAMEFELPAIAASGGGAVVNSATTPGTGESDEAQCVVGLSLAAATDHADRAVRVNTVVAGAGGPADFARIAVWLCSHEAAHVTGTAIPLSFAPSRFSRPGEVARGRARTSP